MTSWALVGHFPNASRMPPGRLLDASRAHPGRLSNASQTPPGRLPDVSRTPPGRLPDASRTSPGRLPEASRTLPGRLPDASQTLQTPPGDPSRPFWGHFGLPCQRTCASMACHCWQPPYVWPHVLVQNCAGRRCHDAAREVLRRVSDVAAGRLATTGSVLHLGAKSGVPVGMRAFPDLDLGLLEVRKVSGLRGVPQGLGGR